MTPEKVRRALPAVLHKRLNNRWVAELVRAAEAAVVHTFHRSHDDGRSFFRARYAGVWVLVLEAHHPKKGVVVRAVKL